MVSIDLPLNGKYQTYSITEAKINLKHAVQKIKADSYQWRSTNTGKGEKPGTEKDNFLIYFYLFLFVFFKIYLFIHFVKDNVSTGAKTIFTVYEQI